MRELEGPPWAQVELIVDGVVVGAGRLDPALACDLRLVDLLFQLRNEACRQGEVLRISGVHQHLRELVELVGLGRHIEP